MKSHTFDKLVKSFFVGLFAFGLNLTFVSAQQVVSFADQDAAKMLNSFYTQYVKNLLHNKDNDNAALMQRYFLPEAINQAEDMIVQSGADGILRAQDVNESMLETLQIVPLGNEWFIVSYQWNEKSSSKVEIPVKMSNETGEFLVKYIVPDDKGMEYGDQLLPEKTEEGIAVPVNVKELRKAFRELVQDQTSAEKQRAFFDAFPKTWDEYILTYDYLPPYKGNLYSYADNHLRAFENLSSIPQDTYCKRLIALSCGGHWEADAPSYLQQLLIKYTMKNLDLVLKQLEVYESDAFYVWQFFFQSLHKEESLLQNYKTIREAVLKNPKLSVDDLDLAFKVSYGRATLSFGGGYPSFDKNSLP